MNFKLILPIWLIFSSILFGDSTADKILTEISQHLIGKNRSMVIESNIIKKGKIKNTQQVKVNLYYPENNDIQQMTFIEFFKPKRKLGVKYWEHKNISGIIQKWITMPITEKLKNISNKKNQKNNFDFSDLQLTAETISNHSNSILDNQDILIIESISKSNKQKKLLYIDRQFNFIQKIEIFNKKDNLLKTIECHDFSIVNNYKVAFKIKMEDFKKKHTVEISITDFQFMNFSDKTIFEPKGN